MGDRHTTVEKYSLIEHAQLRHSLHHNILLEHQRQGRIFLPATFSTEPPSAADVPGEWTVDDYYFLQPVPARQRRSLLREAGVVRIDPMEREECRSLRLSRSRCGCSCRDVCRPPSCPCCRSGIGCQVDQMAFPCSCSHGGCANPHGRVEFNAARVRAHFIRTLLQLGLDQQNRVDECDGELASPPEKRCCLDGDHSPSSVSLSSLPAFSSASMSSLLPVCSTDANGASASTANGFETQMVYFDTVERLPGSETVVVAYDEDYDDEEEDEDSTETSSDGDDASFDRISDDADVETVATLNDPRQRTLDDYVVRFRRQHAYADAEPSGCNSTFVDNGFQFTSLPIPQPSPSESFDFSTAGFRFNPLPVSRPSSGNSNIASNTTEFQLDPLPIPQPADCAGSFNSTGISDGFQFTPLPVLQPSLSNCSSANDSSGFQFFPLPIPPALAEAPMNSMLSSIIALNSSLNAPLSSVVTCSVVTQQCPTTLSSSVDTTCASCMPHSVYIMPNDTRHDHALPGECIDTCSVPEAVDNNCCVPLATTLEFPHVSHSAEDTTDKCSLLDNCKQNSCTRQETTDNCSTKHFNAASVNTATSFTQQDAVHFQSCSDDTTKGELCSVPEDTIDNTGCTIHIDIQSVDRGSCTRENTAQGSSEPHVTDDHYTVRNESLGLDAGRDECCTDDGIAFNSYTAASQDTACRPVDTVQGDCCKADDDTQVYCTVDNRTENDTRGCLILDVEGTHSVSLASDADTCRGSGPDAGALGCTLPRSTNSCLMTETSAGGDDNSTVNSHCCLDNASSSRTAADIDDIVGSCSASDNALDGEFVADDAAVVCSMPHDLVTDSCLPERSAGSSTCISYDTATDNKTDDKLSVSRTSRL